MTNNSLSALLVVATITLMLTTTLVLTELALAAKKSSSIVSSNSTKTSSESGSTTAVTHIKGVKVLRIHTVPSKVAVGSTFNLRAIVFNNSTATITFDNGTCTAPLFATFNKNVMAEPQTVSTACKSQTVTLKHGQQSHILSPNLSGKIYRATAPGTTNATLTFKYGAVISSSKSSINDSISRFYTFNILLPGATSATAPIHTQSITHSTTSRTVTPSPSPPATNSQPGVLKVVP